MVKQPQSRQRGYWMFPSTAIGAGSRLLHDATVGRGATLRPDSATTAGQVVPDACAHDGRAIEANTAPASGLSPADGLRSRPAEPVRIG